jgi:PEP-CTERM motif
MFTTKNYALLLASAVLAAVPSYASSITGFSFTEDPSPFTSVLVETFSGSQASITGTVTCASTTACSGEVGTFDLGLDLTSTTPLSAEISGILSGRTPAVGSLDLTSPALLARDVPFSVAPGSFDKTIFSTSLPAFGDVNVEGALDFSLAAGQSIDLPLTINVGTPSTSPVPEPASQALLVAGLLGMAGVVRYRNRKRTTA